ncbi:MAG: Hsp70 family protein [Planctomycetota bacterium]
MNVVGIDLGTTNSEVSVLADAHPLVLSVDGSPLVPSVVSVDDAGQALVGQSAVNGELLAPERTVRWVKRQMGTGQSLELGGRVWSPAMVSSRILAYLKAAAEAHLGEEVSRAVITVPAFFDERAREDTQQAAELAGLEVLRLLNEPTAAAAAYAMGQRRRERWLIYDLGGGTFDVSVVDCSEDVMEVLASHGDTRLGGHDLDQLVARRAADAFAQEHGIDLMEDRCASLRVLQAAEAAKIQLSTDGVAQVRGEYIAVRDGIDLHLDHRLERHEFEALAAPLIERTLASVDMALSDASCAPSDLARVILVGGTTRMPLVAELLRERLGIEPQGWLDPDRVVARGAAIEAAALAGVSVGAEMVDITPHSLGTKVLSIGDRLRNHILVRRNTPLPCAGSHTFYKMSPLQERIEVDVLQGESPDPGANHLLGRFEVTGLGDSLQMEIHFRFDLDRSGLLRVSVEHLGSGVSVERVIERGDDGIRRIELGEIPAVRLDDAAVVLAADDTDFAPPASALTVDDQTDAATGADVVSLDRVAAPAVEVADDDAIVRAQDLLASDGLDGPDREELQQTLAAVTAREAGAHQQLVDLLYFLE